jgi:hypothetical protein
MAEQFVDVDQFDWRLWVRVWDEICNEIEKKLFSVKWQEILHFYSQSKWKSKWAEQRDKHSSLHQISYVCQHKLKKQALDQSKLYHLL